MVLLIYFLPSLNSNFNYPPPRKCIYELSSVIKKCSYVTVIKKKAKRHIAMRADCFERGENNIFFFLLYLSPQNGIINKCPSPEVDTGINVGVISHTDGTVFSYTNGPAFLELNRHSYRRLISRGTVENVNSRKIAGSFVYSDTRDNHDVLLLIHPLNSPLPLYFFPLLSLNRERNLHRDTLEESSLQAQLIHRR